MVLLISEVVLPYLPTSFIPSKKPLTLVVGWYIIPSVKGTLILHTKVREDTGNIVEVKLWKVHPSKDKPHGYKYSLVYVIENERIIGYDNAEGKGDHRHIRELIEPYHFISLKKLAHDFFRDIERYKRGEL